MMTILFSGRQSDLGPNLLIADGVKLADDVEIGANVVLHEGCSIGAGVRLDDGVILGRVPTFGRRSRTDPPQRQPTTVDAGAIVCPYAIVDAGAWIGSHAFVGDRVSVRGGARLREDVSIGSASVVGPDVDVGERVRTQSHCLIGPGVLIEPDVFLGPAVHILTGRPMSAGPRKPPPVLRRGCQIGAGVQIMPGVEVGEEAVVGAGALVLGDVPPGGVVAGVPATGLGARALP
jgi:acetyltransferase-like isoleucine patch superfamily enzyme